MGFDTTFFTPWHDGWIGADINDPLLKSFSLCYLEKLQTFL